MPTSAEGVETQNRLSWEWARQAHRSGTMLLDLGVLSDEDLQSLWRLAQDGIRQDLADQVWSFGERGLLGWMANRGQEMQDSGLAISLSDTLGMHPEVVTDIKAMVMSLEETGKEALSETVAILGEGAHKAAEVAQLVIAKIPEEVERTTATIGWILRAALVGGAAYLVYQLVN